MPGPTPTTLSSTNTSSSLPLRQLFVSPGGKDEDTGSAATPWASIQHAADSARPGDVIHIAPGVYSGPISSSVSGSPSARIRFVSDLQHAAKISASAYTVWTNKGDYVDILGFDVTGNGSLGVLNMASQSALRGIGCTIFQSDCTSDGGAGIDNGNYSAQDNDIIGNIVFNVGDVNRKCPRVHGIYHSNLGGHIWNNIAFHNKAWGIHLWHAATNVVIANNLSFENGEGGIIIGAGDAPGGVVADNMLVTNNIVSQNPKSIKEVGRSGSNNRYIDNVVFGGNGPELQKGKLGAVINLDPKLVDFHPTGLPAHSGTPEGAPPIDINGGVRQQGIAPDLGPFQSGASPASWPWL